MALPDTFFDWVKLSAESVPAEDTPAADLLQILAQFVQLSAVLRGRQMTDGRNETVDIIEKTLDFERKLEAWENQLEGIWLFSEEKAEGFPTDTVFQSKLHAYAEMWTARIWNHYRWCRLLINQMMLDFADRFPRSCRGQIPEARRKACLDTIRRMAQDTLTSIPTHWRHPRMGQHHREAIEKMSGGPGIGAAGLPSTLFHIKVAACGLGVPFEFYRWGLAILDTVWGDMGMLQAKALADLMRTEHQRQQALLDADASPVVIKQEPIDTASAYEVKLHA